jgi:hypothetical protein
LLQVALGELQRSQLQLHLGQKKSLPYMMYLYHAHDALNYLPTYLPKYEVTHLIMKVVTRGGVARQVILSMRYSTWAALASIKF